MEYIKSITNISEVDLEFSNFTLNIGNSVLLDDNLKKSDNYVLVNRYFFARKVTAYDNNDNEIIDDLIFDNIWSFNKEIYLQKETHPNYFKIYDFLNKDVFLNKNFNFSYTPKSIDYIIDVNLRFSRKETFTKGLLTNVEYYESSITDAFGNTTYSNPILNVNMIYHVNSIGYVSYRETVRKWQTKDGVYSIDTKNTIKYYNNVMAREEGIQRRNNIINQLIIDVVNMTYFSYNGSKTYSEVEQMFVPLMDALENDINKYIKGNVQSLLVAVSNLNNIEYPWIDIVVGGITIYDFINNGLLDYNLTEGVHTSPEPN